MSRVLRIGSRGSELALWQANTVKQKLSEIGVAAEIITIKSEGDLKTDVPIYELGIVGVFTRALDIALLNRDVDIAVHSMKDVPTLLPKGIKKAAVLERANPADVLVHKGLDFLNTEGILATGSLRRKAQWLHRYPLHEVVDLRGNVPTRLKKVEEDQCNAAIFASAGLERLNMMPEQALELEWMVPAPAQGAVMTVALEEDEFALKAVGALNHQNTDVCTRIEREFLRELEGGCSAPIGALAQISGNSLQFKGVLASIDGQDLIEVKETADVTSSQDLGVRMARQILENGGRELMNRIKSDMEI